MGRLIDADKFEAFVIRTNGDEEFVNGVQYVLEKIDNAPTVEAIPKAYLIDTLNNIRLEITTCLQSLDEIEKSGLNIYLPNEISGRRLTYQQCLEFIDKHLEFVDKYKIKVR